MGSFVEAGKAGDLEAGTMRKVSIRGREILLARVGDEYYAAENSCPHMGGNLSQGKLGGTVVTCPWHGSQFDLRSGEVQRWAQMPPVAAAISRIIRPSRPLHTYNVKVEGDSILVEV